MKRNKISISIVTYNSEKHIENLLNSLYDVTKGEDFNITIVDNCSSDNTVKLLEPYKAKGVKVINNTNNSGFGAAHNLAIQGINSDYHVMVNPDITLKEDVFAKMAEYMDNNQDIGLLSPRILYPNGEEQILPKRNPKFIYLLSRRLVRFKSLDKYRKNYEMLEEVGKGHKFDIEFASGCFMFLRTSELKKVGGFDPRYFLYFEDADLSREISKSSRVEYNPDFCVYHNWERAGAKNIKCFLMQVNSMFKYFFKWLFK